MHLPTEEEVDAALMEAVCCRSWPVLPGVRIGRCGYCGEYPVVTRAWADKAADNQH